MVGDTQSAVPMVEIADVEPLTVEFASYLRSRKVDFVVNNSAVTQHGMASISAEGWPGWPDLAATNESVIETYVAGTDLVTAMSDNEPFVGAWLPAARWLNITVRMALANLGVELDGDAYITASLADTDLLEGVAHMDDDTFVPNNSVGVVAIIGQHIGPRVATGVVEHAQVRPMSQIVFDDVSLAKFAADSIDHCRSDGDQLVVFPQFGQLHAGPAARDIEALTRQLFVFRAAVLPRP